MAVLFLVAWAAGASTSPSPALAQARPLARPAASPSPGSLDGLLGSVPPPDVVLDFVEQLGKLGVAEVDNPKGMAEWFAEQRGVTAGGLPVERYVEAARELLAEFPLQRIVPNTSSGEVLPPGAASHPWQWMGPANRGGRTRAFVVDPRDPQVMLAGGITGGVWKSTTGGTSWQPLTDTLANIAVGVLEMDPSNPDVVYAGTGEIYYAPEPYGWYRGGGIMRTVDGGSSWTFLDSTVANPDFAWVGDVEVSPHDPNRLYAATSTGVWLSQDAGLSWTRTLIPRTTAGCLELAVRNDLDPDTVFASCGSEQGTLPQPGPLGPVAGDGVYRSTDGGQTWVRVIIRSGGRAVGVTSLAIAPTDQNVIYANAADLDGNALALFRSTEGGASGTWEIRNAGAPNWFANCRYDYAQGGYDNVVAVDPTDANRIWVGGVDLFRSANGGRTFQIASDWAADETSPVFVHADQHLIVFDPNYDGTTNKTVYFGNDGGIFSTTDDRADLSGSTCGSIQGAAYGSLRTGFGVAQFVGGAVADDGSIILGGTQDNGTVQTTSGQPDDWAPVQGGDGGFAAVDEQRDVRYVTNPRYTDATFGTTYIMMSRSDQGGPFDLKAAADIDAMFYPPLVRDPDDGRILWTGGRSVQRSLDAGDTWESVTDYFDSRVTTIGVAADDGNEVWVGFRDGTLIRSGNALAATPKFVSADPSRALPFAQVSSVAVDPMNHRTAFVTISEFDGHQVWRTADAGATWTALDADLPDVPANAVAINPRNPAMVYVGNRHRRLRVAERRGDVARRQPEPGHDDRQPARVPQGHERAVRVHLRPRPVSRRRRVPRPPGERRPGRRDAGLPRPVVPGPGRHPAGDHRDRGPRPRLRADRRPATVRERLVSAPVPDWGLAQLVHGGQRVRHGLGGVRRYAGARRAPPGLRGLRRRRGPGRGGVDRHPGRDGGPGVLRGGHPRLGRPTAHGGKHPGVHGRTCLSALRAPMPEARGPR